MNPEMTVKEEEWYTLKHRYTREGEENSIDKTEITLEIKKLSSMKNTRTLAREYYTSKYSVFQADPQFQIKLAVSSGRHNDIEIYWRTKTSNFIQWTLLCSECSDGPECTSTGFSCFGTLKPMTKHEQKTDFKWIPENQWQLCDTFDVSSFILLFTFRTLVDARINSAPTLRQQELNSDFENLLFNNTDSNYDVTIKSVEGEEFKAHKNILAVRCKVLKAHFEHNTKESTTSIVETQWETKVLRDVLTYLYTGSAPGINNEPGKLLNAADFYQLEGLKSLCVETMIEMLTVENATETLQMALLHSLNTLRDKTLQFIKDGHARLITETAAWANVSNEVMKMIYEFITADEKISYNILAESYAELKSK